MPQNSNGKDILYPLRLFHGWLHKKKLERIDKKAFKSQLLEKLAEQPDAAFLVLTPHHGNSGDHAIAMAETQMLDRLGIPYIELTVERLYALSRYGMLGMMNRHTIIYNGGGNLGTLWYGVERVFRKTIRKAPDSSIILMPNSIFYEDTKWGKKELDKSVKIYNKHPNLYLYARERLSYQFMKDLYRNVKLIPDMVLSYEHWGNGAERIGCLLCLRNDCEKTMDETQTMLVSQQAQALFPNQVGSTDTVYPHHVELSRRKEAVEQKLGEFASSQLVITDRLHGMIFCAITGTPCIVLNSRSPKLSGCYAWISHLPYIRFIDDAAQISEAYHSIPKEQFTYNRTPLQDYFSELQKDISRIYNAQK